MDREVTGDVYQITVLNKMVGERPGFIYQVGREYTVKGKKFPCSRLIYDENSYYFTGQSVWSVYLKDPKTGLEFKHVDLISAGLEVKMSIPKELL